MHAVNVYTVRGFAAPELLGGGGVEVYPPKEKSKVTRILENTAR